MQFLGHACDNGFIPHRPDVWPAKFANLRNPLVLRRWNQRKPDLPEYTEIPLEAGARVKIVMASRFGDVGITNDLTAENGYDARVYLADLCDFGVSA